MWIHACMHVCVTVILLYVHVCVFMQEDHVTLMGNHVKQAKVFMHADVCLCVWLCVCTCVYVCVMCSNTDVTFFITRDLVAYGRNLILI